MIRKFIIFLAISMAIVSLGSAWRTNLERINIGRTCTNNQDCIGRKVCKTQLCRLFKFCTRTENKVILLLDKLRQLYQRYKDSRCASKTCNDKCAENEENDAH